MSGDAYYPDLPPVSTGIRGKCPRCGRGRLFAGFLDVAAACSACKLTFDFADAGDGASWFVMLVAGVLATGTALWIEITWQPSYWVHALAAIPLAIAVPILLLRPVKGVLICQQYVTRAREGRTG